MCLCVGCLEFCFVLTMAFDWKASHSNGATLLDCYILLKRQEQTCLQFNDLQQYAVVLTVCNCLKLSWQSPTVLAVCNCLNCLKRNWQSATFWKGHGLCCIVHPIIHLINACIWDIHWKVDKHYLFQIPPCHILESCAMRILV